LSSATETLPFLVLLRTSKMEDGWVSAEGFGTGDGTMPTVGFSRSNAAKQISGKVTGIYPDRRGVVVEFDTPVIDADRQKRTLGYARRGTPGLGLIINRIRRGTPVVVKAEFGNAGLATITSIQLAG
jgi:hypothetical protein